MKIPKVYLAAGTVLFCLATFLMLSEPSDELGNGAPLPDKVSYNFDIRPVLSDKCFACHGPDENKREAGLRLDIAKEAYKALKENPQAHAVVPGNPQASELYLRIISDDETIMMPPPSSNLKLTAREVALLKKWIAQGAPYEKHWAFIPPARPQLPEVREKGWPRNEIDYFLLHKQEKNGLRPNPEAHRERLLRRVSIDLTGLPPDLETMDRFLNDNRPDAYEALVDQLLDNPAYGEKMALHWLDVGRYADSYGYQMDNFRSQWPWRDWVIHAFNRNMSYKDFVTWQIAGDLLPHATKEQLLATGFNRNHKITEEGAVDEEEYRVTYVTDRTDTFGKAFLGVTLECARCHDHKYDPLSQKEYYQLFSFFNQVDELRAHYTAIDPTVGKPESYAKKPLMEISDEDLEGILSFVNKPDSNKLIISVMGDLDTLRPTFLLQRGVFDAYGEPVAHGTPQSILPFDRNYPGNRLGLARWLFDRRNPLTARVFVNRIWQELFGKGLVKTAGDFGMQGELPSHPELLDWLAVDFMEHDWDIKRLVRLIVTSAAYRQSAAVTGSKQKKDPDNVLLSRFPRYHIQAEFVRDMVLSSSGLLHRVIGGPSVRPYQPPGLWESATAGGDLLLSTYKQDHGPDLYRRGIYTFVKRTVPPPSMVIFDASNRDQCEVTRSRTSTPLQALIMMNDPTVLEASRVLAERLLAEEGTTEERIRRAFRLIICRTPGPRELATLVSYYDDGVGTLDPAGAKALVSVGEYPRANGIDVIPVAALMQVISAIYNLEETITKS